RMVGQAVSPAAAVAFPVMRILQELWGGPPGPRGSPLTKLPLEQMPEQKVTSLDRSSPTGSISSTTGRPASGPAADRGSAPQFHAGPLIIQLEADAESSGSVNP